MRDLQHRDKAAHLYESTPGLWVLSSVFAPGCTVANAFCHHPNPGRKVSQMVSGSRFPEMEPEKPPTRETAGAPLGPHQWHFYTPPKKVELSPDGQFMPGTRNSRGGWLSASINITVRDPFGRTQSGKPEVQRRRRLTAVEVHPLRPQLVEIYLKHNRNKMHEIDGVLRCVRQRCRRHPYPAGAP